MRETGEAREGGWVGGDRKAAGGWGEREKGAGWVGGKIEGKVAGG